MSSIDVLVVGSGVAGLSCAIEAAEAGATVVVLEAEAAIGGASAMSGGGCFFVDTPLQRARGIDDSAEFAMADIVAAGGGSTDLVWARRYVENCNADVYDFCEELGVRWANLLPSEGCRVPRWHFPEGMGRAVVEQMESRATSLGVRIVCRSSVQKLIVEGSEVRGVAALEAGAPREYVSKAVVVCAGGFAGSFDMVARYAPQLVALPRFLSGSSPTALGLGTLLLSDAGAGFRSLESMSVSVGTPDPQDAAGHRGLILMGIFGGIWINADGERFFDESIRGGPSGSRALVQQPGSTAWVVFNEAELTTLELGDNEYWGRTGRGTSDRVFEFLERSAYTRRGDTPAALATAIGLPPAAVARTIADFNAAVGSDTAVDPRFGRGLTGVAPLAGPGLVAIQIFPLAQKSLGGVRTDLDCQVLDERDVPIRGLYAAGEVAGMAGGCLNGSSALDGTMFGPSIFSGRVAGRAASARLLMT